MEKFKHKPGQGSIFKNDKKEKESQPDYTGSANVNGVDMRVALWVKEGQKGKFFSMAINTYEKKEETPF
jgi:hypothetical protein